MRFDEALQSQEEAILNCVHCGFCLPACPTYVRLGDEADSPRGRLHLMRAVVEGRLDPGSDAFQDHIGRCLGCRACEPVCPSGVQYGMLLERARQVATSARPPARLTRLLLALVRRDGVRRLWLGSSRLLRDLGIPEGLLARLPEGPISSRMKTALAMLASSAPSTLSIGAPNGAEEVASRSGSPNGSGFGAGVSVGLLEGCVQKGLFGRVNRATERVLGANGYRVVSVRSQGCCGALHAHAGDLTAAREMARRNIAAFEEAGVDLVAVNAAGCGAAMVDYGHLLSGDAEWGGRARSFAGRVRDVSQLLTGGDEVLRGAPLPLRVAYDPPCHLLHAQKIRHEPLRMLEAIPELEVVAVPNGDECCGGAGIYGLTHPELGGRIGSDKVEAVVATGAPWLATGNPGCIMQIGAGLRIAEAKVEVCHPVELLDESYRRGGVYEGRRGAEGAASVDPDPGRGSPLDERAETGAVPRPGGA